MVMMSLLSYISNQPKSSNPNMGTTNVATRSLISAILFSMVGVLEREKIPSFHRKSRSSTCCGNKKEGKL